jgi:hypothetical protein
MTARRSARSRQGPMAAASFRRVWRRRPPNHETIPSDETNQGRSCRLWGGFGCPNDDQSREPISWVTRIAWLLRRHRVSPPTCRFPRSYQARRGTASRPARIAACCALSSLPLELAGRLSSLSSGCGAICRCMRLDLLIRGRRSRRLGLPLAQHHRPPVRLSLRLSAGGDICGTDR